MLYLFTDLDRTLLPNGNQPESPMAHEMLAKLTARPDVVLTYVSGRSLVLIEQAIEEYDIPEPDYIVGDVGTVLYKKSTGCWQLIKEWHEHIGQNWNIDIKSVVEKLKDVGGIWLQEQEKQSPFKLSYYVEQKLLAQKENLVKRRLAEMSINAAVIASYDETEGLGFIDILPPKATKLDAVRFLMRFLGAEVSQTVYCGDSGNDLPVLTSEIPSILVANAEDVVKEMAIKGAGRNKCPEMLYLAKGDWGLNGNYSAGILEGVAHFQEQYREWLVSLTRSADKTV